MPVLTFALLQYYDLELESINFVSIIVSIILIILCISYPMCLYKELKKVNLRNKNQNVKYIGIF